MFGIGISQMTTALYIAGGSIIAAFLLYLLLKKIVSSLVNKTGTTLDNEILGALDKPLVIAVMVLGIYLAIKSLSLNKEVFHIVNVVVLSLFVAVLIFAINALLQGIFNWYEREIATRTKTTLDNKLIPFLRKFAILSVCFTAIVWILEITGINLPWLKSWIFTHGMRMAIIAALSMSLIFFIGRLVPAAMKPAVMRKAKNQPEEEIEKRVETLSGVLVGASEVVIIFLSSFMLLSEIGVNIAPLLAGAGVVGLAIGFGAQNIIKDVLNGFFIITENQYTIGDVVKVADVSGLVEDLSLRRTVLRDMDGIVHSVPNGDIHVSSNLTREWSRVNLNISVAYGEDLERVISVINKVGKELAGDQVWAPYIIKTPQALRVDNLGDSGIEIKILGDTKPMKQWDVTGELRKRLKIAFDVEGIEIPWPHTKMYFGNFPKAFNSPINIDKPTP